MKTLLKVKGLSKHYKDEVGVFNFNLSLSQGEIVLVLGPNGAGKTTLLRGILGLTSLDGGSLVFNDKDIKENPTDFLRSVGALVSSPAYYEYMTGYENLTIYAGFYGRGKKDILKALDLVDLTHAKDKKVREYSTGMKQRLDFARGILHEPEILILDEPFNGMDIEQKSKLKDYLRAMADQGKAIVISSHMAAELYHIADRLVIIHKGRCLYDGSVAKVMKDYGSLESFYLSIVEGSETWNAAKLEV